jgi:hypothetical protein
MIFSPFEKIHFFSVFICGLSYFIFGIEIPYHLIELSPYSIVRCSLNFFLDYVYSVFIAHSENSVTDCSIDTLMVICLLNSFL